MHVKYRVTSAEACVSTVTGIKHVTLNVSLCQTLVAISVFILNTSHYHHQHHHHPSGILANGLFPFSHNVNIPRHSGTLRKDGSRGNGTLRRFRHATLHTYFWFTVTYFPECWQWPTEKQDCCYSACSGNKMTVCWVFFFTWLIKRTMQCCSD